MMLRGGNGASAKGSGRSQPPLSKRPRTDSTPVTLKELCTYPFSEEKWKAAAERALSFPEEAAEVDATTSSSPLALACRHGAPLSCVRAILEAAPEQLHRLVPSRGTPLHESIVCDTTEVEVIELLLRVDEDRARDSGSTRATLTQDVDGHTPLHLLIRRRFQYQNAGDRWKALLLSLVKSCPQAVGIPDRGEYEEPPLVMALKASLYAVGTDERYDRFCQRVEGRIHEMVQCMLHYYPQAAGKVLTGARGRYTALHSAVFHGRCSDTINLLLQAESKSSRSPGGAALLANTQGELPLHFAAMRGEPPRSIALLGNAAPKAVLTRDASGLTPMHWLWVRFVSTLLALDNERGETTVESARPGQVDPYFDFASIEFGQFYPDFNLVRNLDPPVDFLRMRHIPQELLKEPLGGPWVQQSIDVLQATRERYNSQNEGQEVTWARRDAVTCLFWTKVVSLLRAALKSLDLSDEFYLVHAAMECPSCPPALSSMVCALFPQELSLRDRKCGRLPLHYAASRLWHQWDWPRGADAAPNTVTQEPAAVQLLRGESLQLLDTAIQLSPPHAARVMDHEGRLVLHHVIDSFVRACSRSGRSYMIDAHRSSVVKMLEILQRLVRIYPDSLERRDAKTKLFPFLQATAAAVEYRSPPSPNGFSVPFPDEMPLTLVFELLRENPSLVMAGVTH